MAKVAVLSFCPDLRDPKAENIQLFRVSLDPDSKLNITFLQSLEDVRRIVTNHMTFNVIQVFPWVMTALLAEVGAERFFDELALSSKYSSVFVDRIEPC